MVCFTRSCSNLKLGSQGATEVFISVEAANHSNKANQSDSARAVRLLECSCLADQVWLTDITYMRVNGEFKYLATVLDKFSRKLIAWSIGDKKFARLTKRTLKRALKQRRPKQKPISRW